MAARFSPASTVLALAASAIWAWHPVQTESVTYLSQRAESLMGLFYLLTLYCFARGAQSGGTGGGLAWYLASILACLAGSATKEVIVTAPLMVFLYDRTFVSGSFAGAWRRHWPVHTALAASLILLGCLMAGIQGGGVGFSLAYGVLECRVVVKYLLLSIWPHPLVFDYGRYAAVSLSQVWPFALVLAALLCLALAALRSSPPLGFALCWFFLILAPTSSIFSILDSPMAENRLYLPLAGVAAGVVVGAYALAGRRCLPALALAAAGLALAAAGRNNTYSSERGLWADTVAKAPANARALNNLACIVLVADGPTKEAIAGFEQALRLRPDFTEAHNDLARALTVVPGRLDEAIAQCKEALREYPDYAEAHCTLGYALARIPGRLDDAIAQYREAIRLKPDLAEAHENLGNAWYRLPGHLDDAIAEYRTDVRLRPDSAEAHFDLGSAWSLQPARLDDAIGEFEAALRIRPDYAEARVDLGNLWMRVPERLNDAIAQYEAAVRLAPSVAELHGNLGYALSAAGRTREAIAQCELALRLKPDLPRVRELLAKLRATQP